MLCVVYVLRGLCLMRLMCLVCPVSWVMTGYACVGALLPRISHSK